LTTSVFPSQFRPDILVVGKKKKPVMRYHVVLSRFIDFPAIEEGVRRGSRPRHAMKQLADRLDATIHWPTGQKDLLSDRAWSQLIGRGLWGYARQLAAQFSADDVIYCPDEQIGLPLTALCSRKKDRPKLVIMVHNVDRPRTRAALRIRSSFRSADVFLSVSNRQLQFLRERVGIEKSRTLFVPDQTDLQFFRPSPVASSKQRPLLVSAGLEKRDYAVLAQAISGLDLEVSLTGFSADSAAGSSRFPEVWPSNFTRRRYEWTELAELYRNADAVVVTLLPNIYAAGVTTMVEGMASARPIIVTKTEGLDGYLDDTDALTLVPPGDAEALRTAIVDLLNSPETIAARGRRGAEIASERYGSDTHVETIAKIMEGLTP
jgi:glycosyltransferase involved in cell wall biosynthesis